MRNAGQFSKIDETIAILQESRQTVLLSGAGVSTPSGIPDFRSTGKGLWNKYNPAKVASLSVFQTQPTVFFGWLHPLAKLIQQAQPNPAHQAIAALQSSGWVSTIITQNIDGLHSTAGNKNVIELHGNIQKWKCLHGHPVEDQMQVFINYCDTETPPICAICGSILKPDMILFEEMLPTKAWDDAIIAASTCDCILVAGSSLSVTPANELPLHSLKNNAKLIIITLSETPLDYHADVVLHENVEIILPKLVQAL
jgi:NAD-dependent deacetylase